MNRFCRRGLEVFQVAHKKPRPASRCVCVDTVGRGCAKYFPHCNQEPGFFVIAVEKFFSFRPDWHQDDRAKPVVRQYQTVLDGLLRSHPELTRGLTCCADCRIRFLSHPCNANRRDLRCPFGCRKRRRRELGNRRSAKYANTSRGREQKKLHNQRRSRRIATSGSDQQLDARPLHDHSPKDGDLAVEVSSHPERPSPGESPGESVSRPAAEEAHLELSAETTFRDQPRRPERHVVVATHTESRHTAGSVEGSEEPPLTLPLEGLSLDEASVAQSPMLEYVRMVASLIEGRSVGREELVEALRKTMRQRSLAQRSRTDYILHFLHQHPP